MHLGEKSMDAHAPAFAHGPIREIFPDIFFVTGASVFEYEGNSIQKSNNMVIVRNGDELTLINTLRLNKDGLEALDKLGKVTNVIRLGAFHDRNDAFFLDRYKAKLWALKGMVHKNNHQTDFLIGETDAIPFPGVSFFVFETTSHPEAILHVARLGGILIACDSIKNWEKVDEYFSEKTGKEFLKQGLIAPANIDTIWLGAMKPRCSDFLRLKKLSFRHLLSAHGQPIINTAREQLMPTLERLSNSIYNYSGSPAVIPAKAGS
jgi:hypothetical protein